MEDELDEEANEEDNEEDKELEDDGAIELEEEGEGVDFPACAAASVAASVPPGNLKLWQRLKRPGLQLLQGVPLLAQTQFLQTPLLLHKQHFTMSQRTADSEQRRRGL